MGKVWIIILTVHLLSLFFLVSYLAKLKQYVRKYNLPESRYTLLFGSIHLSQVLILYLSTIAFNIFLSFYFLISIH